MTVQKIIVNSHVYYVTKEAIYLNRPDDLLAIPCLHDTEDNLRYIHKAADGNMFYLILDDDFFEMNVDAHTLYHSKYTKICLNNRFDIYIVLNMANKLAIRDIIEEYINAIPIEHPIEISPDLQNIMSQPNIMDKDILDIVSHKNVAYLITETMAFAMQESGQISPVDISGPAIPDNIEIDHQIDRVYIQGDGDVCSRIERNFREVEGFCYVEYVFYDNNHMPVTTTTIQNNEATGNMLATYVNRLVSKDVGRTPIISQDETEYIERTFSINKDVPCESTVINFFAHLSKSTLHPIFPDTPIFEQLLYDVAISTYTYFTIPQFYIAGETCPNRVLAHGDGVCNQVLFMLSEEINAKLDDILHGRNENIPVHRYVLMGKLMAVCAVNQGIKLDVHPYFYYLLTKGTYGSHILGLVKDSRMAAYYRSYKEDPTLLENLDMGLSTHVEYLEHVLGNDLSDEQKNIYAKIATGFISRINMNNIFCDFPLRHLISHMCDAGFSVEWNFINMDYGQEEYQECCDIFHRIIDNLDKAKYNALVRNITGVQHGKHIITVRLSPGYDGNDDISYRINTCEKTLVLYVPSTEYETLFTSLIDRDILLLD